MRKEIKVKNFKLYDECWKLVNYITLSQNYLNSFVNFDSEILLSNLKEKSFGHWGACPSINLLYIHLIKLFQRHNLKANIIVGTGHAGSSVSANLWLTGIWEKIDKKYNNNFQGLGELIENFGGNIRSEINPEYPTTIFDGGELGYSLAFAYGYSLKSNLDILPCIIGDGECETATLMASWQLNKVVRNAKVLPIINLNKYKMCSPSTFSKMTNNELASFFKSFGYTPIFCTASHSSIYSSLEKAYCLIKKNQTPVIIFKSKKGLTGLCDNQISIEGNILSHKDPLSKLSANEKLNVLNKWKNNYKFELTSEKLKEICEFCKFDFYIEKNKEQQFDCQCDKSLNTFKDLENYLSNLMEEDKIYVFSPDEINSNKLSNLNNYNNLMELLSENVLEGVYQGFCQAGNVGLFVSYEAFVSVFISMVSQYQKYIYQAEVSKRDKRPSLNFLLTSTVFENTYSHQNPEFVSSLLSKNYNNINCYYPINSKGLLKDLQKSFASQNKINVITLSKNIKINNKYAENANDIIYLNRCTNPDFVHVATGDYLFNQQLRVKQYLDENAPNLKIKYVYISNLNVLTNDEKVKEIFNGKGNIYSFMGYQSVIKNLLYDKVINLKILGYQDKSIKSTSVENKLRVNNMGDESIINLIIKKELN